MLHPEKQKTGARKYSATPVSKPDCVAQKQVEYHLPSCLPVQNSSHPPSSKLKFAEHL
jgi:hypothetical protein